MYLILAEFKPKQSIVTVFKVLISLGLIALASGCAQVADASPQNSVTAPLPPTSAALDQLSVFSTAATPEDILPKSLAIDLTSFPGTPQSRRVASTDGKEFYLSIVGPLICIQYGSGADTKHFDGATGCTPLTEITIHPLVMFDEQLKIGVVLLPDGCLFAPKSPISAAVMNTKNLSIVTNASEVHGAFSCTTLNQPIELNMQAISPPK